MAKLDLSDIRSSEQRLLDELRQHNVDVSNPRKLKCPFHKGGDEKKPSACIEKHGEVYRFRCRADTCDTCEDIIGLRAKFASRSTAEVIRDMRRDPTTADAGDRFIGSDNRVSLPVDFASQKSDEKKTTYYDTLDEAIAAVKPRNTTSHRPFLFPDADGDLWFLEVRFNLRSGDKLYYPFSRNDEGRWACTGPGRARPLYRLPAVLESTGPVLIVEGAKCGEAAGLSEIMPWTAWSGGMSAVHNTDYGPLAGRDVWLWPDVGGEKAIEKLEPILAALDPPARLSVIRGHSLADKEDVEQWMERRGAEETRESIRAAIAAMSVPIDVAEPQSTPPAADTPADDSEPAMLEPIEINVDNPEQYAEVDKAIVALSRDADIYSRSGILVRMTVDPDAEREELELLPMENLRERLSRFATFVNDKGQRRQPASWIANQLLARGQWPTIREAKSLSRCPTMRPDGTIHESGYDPITKVIVTHAVQLDVPDRPSREDARAAAAKLRDLICNFPMASESHRSVWLAAVLTLCCRNAFTGSPLGFMFDAPKQGSGKGLAISAAHIIAHGREPRWTQYSSNREEVAKSILAMAIAGRSVVAFDNIEGTLGDPALASAMTGGALDQRILGASKQWQGDFSPVYLFSANNVKLNADMPRRLLSCRIVPDVEDPSARKGFTHEDLKGHIAAHRPEYLSAAMTIVRAYIQAGKPRVSTAPIGSFEGWSRTIRDAIVWTGLADPSAHSRDFAERADDDRLRLRELMRVWPKLADDDDQAFYSQDVIERLYLKNGPQPANQEDVDCRAAIEAFAGFDPRSATAARLSYALRTAKDRIENGMKITSDPKTNRGVRWFLAAA